MNIFLYMDLYTCIFKESTANRQVSTKVMFKNLSNKTPCKMCIMEFPLCGRNNTSILQKDIKG